MNFIGWENDWNTIIRHVIFADSELKELMMIPENTNIVTFVDKYFIRAGYTSELLKNEDVRVVYSDVKGSDTKVPNIKYNMLTFDIYVKTKHVRDATNDRLMLRTHLIANRIFQLLTKSYFIEKTGYHFQIEGGPWDFGTRTVGYSRATISLRYMKVY